jgi:hypothetical protein
MPAVAAGLAGVGYSLFDPNPRVFIAQVSLQMHKFPPGCATNLPATKTSRRILREIHRTGFDEREKIMGWKR